MTTPLLEIRGLTKTYGSVVALDDVAITIRAGTIYGFIGPNGAGKTTAIRILAGLVRPNAGEVSFGGRDLLADRLHAATRLRTLVEVPAFYPNLTGAENLRVHARLAGAPPSDVEVLLDAVALREAADRKVGGYSLGMRQRLGIAQALVGRPSLVVLDEPMNGLDPAGMREMRHLIRRVRDENGTAFLISSHLLTDVQHSCDEVGILHRGHMVAEGAIHDLIPQTVTGFAVETVDNARAAAVLSERRPELGAELDQQGRLRVAGDESVLPALHQALLEASLPAVALEPQRASLERFFLEKTEGVIG